MSRTLAFGENNAGFVLQKYAALMQHGDSRRNRTHKAHVVFDDDDGALLADAADDGGDLIDFGVAHAGGWLVEQNEAGAARQHDGDLGPLAQSVRQRVDNRVAVFGDIEFVEQLFGRQRCRFVSRPRPVRRKPHILEHAKTIKQLRHLGLGADAKPRDAV